MIELPMIPGSEAMSESDAESPANRPPLRELLPAGSRRAVVAALAAALVVAGFADFGTGSRAWVGLVFCPALVLLAAVDLEHRLLPNDIVLPAVLAVALILAATQTSGFLTHLAAGAALGAFFFAFAAFIPGSIGMGDAKVGFLLGLALGWQTLSAMMIALLALLLAALWVLARQGMSARKQTLPFGPFLALGGILALFLG